MKARSLNVMIWFLALIVAIDAKGFVCTTPTPSTTKAPPTPIIPDSYQAHIEVNILDKKYSMVVDEYLDYAGNRAAMHIHKDGQVENMIFSYDTNEVFDVNNQSCTLYTVDNTPFNLLFGPVSGSTSGNTKHHVYSASASLRFTASNNLIYVGTGTVREIPADIWSGCIAWPTTSGNIKTTYYFSQLNWNTSSPQPQTPLRVEVEGMYSAPSISAATNGPAAHFHHSYDIIGYLPYVDADPSIFQTPPQVICLNRTSGKQLPQFASHFRYKAEIVDSKDSFITHYAIWYDEGYKMVREDTRKQQNGLALNTTTEIHDFNTGVRYIIDPIAGCTIKTIDPSLADTEEDVARLQFNGSLLVDIRDPNSFFILNSNYTYTGQRTVRGITCDIYSAIIPNYELQGATVAAIFEYAFLGAGWSDLPLYATETNVQNYPVQLVISVASAQYTRVINFFEFSEDPVTYPAFDVSFCFDEKQKLGFQLTFPGAYSIGLKEQWTSQVYDSLVQAMNVFPIRVGGITVTNDDDNIYVNAYVLGSSSTAQFEKKATLTLERKSDDLIKGITSADDCATLCVDNTVFICQSFQFCPDDGQACRLNIAHTATQNVTRNATACDEFTRTVIVSSKHEPALKDAYTSLQSAVTEGSLQVVITGTQGSAQAPFVAIDVDLTSGEIAQSKPLPSMPSAFSYRLETVVASSMTVQETYVWYDQNISLVRYDNRDPTSGTPYMQTHIHDFNLGVAYQINQGTQECIVSPISSSGVFDVSSGTVSSVRNGGLIMTMKTPNALLFLDDTYSYIGQSTARGILCDVFESKRGDFDLEYYNMSSRDTVFKYYFQASSWTYISPQSTGATQNQPVQLNVEDKSTGEFLIYNFYDFTEQHFPASFYDASACYSTDEKKSFLIAFKNQPYSPVLDRLSEVFLARALDQLAEYTYTSPINFQHASITYDDNDVYLIVTALGHTTLLDMFSAVMKVDHNTTVPQINALSNSDCAAACVLSTTFICNSFDYCQDTSIPNCLLGSTHTETEGDPLDTVGPCTHYSRSENGTYPTMSIAKMYSTISNYVYDNKFQIVVTLQNGSNFAYLATDIRDDILRPTDDDGTSGSYLQKFAATTGFQLIPSLVALTHNSVSITDCAMLCIQENTFDCEAFDYQFSLGTCRVSNVHPDQLNKTNPGVSKNPNTSVYSRLYTADYIKYGAQVYGTHPDKAIANIPSDELCARACTDNSDFVCEAFETCEDGSCILRKTHIIEVSPADTTQNPNCVHYSRNHLFDFVRRDHQIIDGHDDSSLLVDDASVCAQLCGTGEGLPYCASFEVCQKQEGVTTCVLSTADPTTQKNISIINSLECYLYTRANSNGASTIVTARSGTGTPVTSKSAGECAEQNDNSSDTGPRVGIAFGTLILGLVVGCAGMFLFMRFRFGRHGDQDGGTVLKTWDTS